MTKRISKLMAVVLLVVSTLIGIHNGAFAADLSSDTTNKLVYARGKYDNENTLYGTVSYSEVKTKTFKVSVPKGSFYINIMDNSTAFKVDVLNSKNKVVKTLKSGKISEINMMENTVELAKGTYTIKVSSLSKEKLNSSMTIAVFKSSTTRSIDLNFSYTTVVKAKKTYKQTFDVTLSSDYRITALVDVLDTKDTEVYLQKATIKDSKGNVVASQKAKTLKSMDEYQGWIVSLKEGKYTLEITTNKTGLLDTYILDTNIGY